MNLIRSACLRFTREAVVCRNGGGTASYSSWASFTERMVGNGVSPIPSWHCQQIRTKKRGTEYQPKTIKRIRTHGWIKRISTQGGIEVILRRMLKGRKSLSH